VNIERRCILGRDSIALLAVLLPGRSFNLRSAELDVYFGGGLVAIPFAAGFLVKTRN